MRHCLFSLMILMTCFSHAAGAQDPTETGTHHFEGATLRADRQAVKEAWEQVKSDWHQLKADHEAKNVSAVEADRAKLHADRETLHAAREKLHADREARHSEHAQTTPNLTTGTTK
jgi:Skp family chaperone for outer membrane proteins